MSSCFRSFLSLKTAANIARVGKVGKALGAGRNGAARDQGGHEQSNENAESQVTVDDQLLKKAAELVNAAKGDEAAVKKAVDLAALAKATAKVSDDEAVMISDLVKQARGDEAHAMRFILGTSQKEGKKITDESTALVSANIAQAVTKNRKSWPRLKKFAKIVMGATVGGFAIYGAYKLLFDKNQ
ncbi:hypothetical protein PInf_018641 [Phytophthora infestans]|nr:hypothetical protein PInf_018641 [Phytophthora infestans]